MRRVMVLFVLACVVILHSSPARAIVYLNRIWDEQSEDFVVGYLVIEGEGLTLDRTYQNAYGAYYGFPPGPPFILERSIYVKNTYLNEDHEVDKWGSLTINSGGLMGDPFEIYFNIPEDLVDVEILTSGPLNIIGTSLDPIILKGAISIRSNYVGGDIKDRSVYYSYDVNIKHCFFVEYIDYWANIFPGPMHFVGGNIDIEYCTFSNITDNCGHMITFYDPRVPSDTYESPEVWSFRLKNCTFQNCETDYDFILLEHLDALTIENNLFTNNTFDTFDIDNGAGVCTIGFSYLRSIKGNAGTGNTRNAIRFKRTNVDYVNAYLESSEQMPFLVSYLMLNEGAGLEIGDGSVLKMYGTSAPTMNILVSGDLKADGAVFTSWQDDSHGGDTDLEPQPSYVGRWGSLGGIQVDSSGTLELRNSTMQYADGGIYAYGDLSIDGCTFRLNDNSAVVLRGSGNNHFDISNSTFMKNESKGISFSNSYGSIQRLTVDKVVSVQNETGIYLGLTGTGLADVRIDRSVCSGNAENGIHAKFSFDQSGSAIGIRNSILSGNIFYGFKSEDPNLDSPPDVRLEGNLIAGNGYVPGQAWGYSGAVIYGCNIDCINNTIAYNRDQGFIHVTGAVEQDSIVNNVFFRNEDYAYSETSTSMPYMAFNDFWENDGTDEINFYHTSGSAGTVEELQALGGDYATNLNLDPEFELEIEGAISLLEYDAEEDQTVLVNIDGVLDGAELDHRIVKPDIDEDPWFFVYRHAGDSLFVLGDITDIAAVDDTFRVFDHHLVWSSGLVDAGRTASAYWPLDIDGEHRVIDGDGDLESYVDLGAEEYGADSMTLVLLAPGGDAFWIPGEEHYIEWSAVGIDTVNLYFQAHYDPDSSFGSLAAGLAASEGRYEWTVPDTLSAKCVVRITDKADTTRGVDSDLFTIKGHVLTRFDMDGEYESFTPPEDGWGFPNEDPNMWPETWWNQFDYLTGTDPYTGEPYPDYFTEIGFVNAQPDDFPDWPLFVEAFGEEQCYVDTPGGPVQSPAAVYRWSTVKKKWEGSCLGFAVTSLQAFDDKTTFLATFPDVSSFDSLFTLPLTDDHRKTLNLVMIYQYGRSFKDRVIPNLLKTPSETLHEIEQLLLADGGEVRWLYMTTRNNSGAHAVSPYRVRKHETESEYYWIDIYDPNYPGDTTASIWINTALDGWGYNKSQMFGGYRGLFLGDPVSNYWDGPLLVPGLAPASHGDLLLPALESYQEFYSTAGIQITIVDDSGHSIGFGDSTTFNTIPDAVPLIPIESEYQPPIGYLVPAGDYSIGMSVFPDSLVVFSAAMDSMVFRYSRSDADTLHTDRITYGDGFLISNYDADPKMINMETIAVGEEDERVFDLTNIGLLSNDSLEVGLPDRETCSIANLGSAKGYDIGIRRVYGGGSPLFEHGEITLPSNTTHIFAPDWGDLGTALLKIYIDIGNDGVVDDSMFVSNEHVATLLQEFSTVFRGLYVEIDWRLSEVDDGIEFIVLRAPGGSSDFQELSGMVVEGKGLSFTLRDYSIEPGEDYRYRVLYVVDEETRILFETDTITTPALPLSLFQNYPNPFNPITRIRYYLPSRVRIRLEIYDVVGRRITRLVDSTKDKGYHVVEWDGKNNSGHPVSSGLYFYRLTAGKRTISKKLILLR